MTVVPPTVPVVVQVIASPYAQPAPASGVVSPGDGAARAPVAGAGFDPYHIAKTFPDRWAEYIRAQFASPAHVMMVFAVSERTAYRWWKGQGGVNGGHVAMAMHQHPVEAPQILFAA